MAPRSEYILPQVIQSNKYTTNSKPLQTNSELIIDDNHGAISIFQYTLPNGNLLTIDDDMQIDDKDVQQLSTINCSCHKSRVRRSLLPELEQEAIRLSPAGPWFTLSRSQYERSKCQRKKVNDPVKQILFM